MPIYLYRASGEQACDHCRDGFEKLQKLNDQPVGRCPRCGSEVGKIITGVNLGVSTSDLGKDNLEKHGFTQYRKLEKGVYEKSAGRGPDIITDKES